MYNLKIICIMPHGGTNIKHLNSSPREIANFHKIAKIYTRENIYLHRTYLQKGTGVINCLIGGTKFCIHAWWLELNKY